MTCRIKHSFLIAVTLTLLLACGITDQFGEPTPTATYPPISLTDTPVSTLTLKPTSIPGWKKFKGGGVVLWLPESFEGGDLSEDLEWILERMAELGPEFERYSQVVAENPDAFIIYALNSSKGPDGFITNVNVFKEQVPSSITLNLYINEIRNQVTDFLHIVNTETLTINQYDAGKIEVEYELEGRSVHQVMYLFIQSSFVWGVTFSTSSVEFDQWLPIFEQSIATFKIKQ
jgi:hypothetical protein